MSIYDTLNPEQRKAVEHDRGPLLILAGAGSGKTRVLTHRIAYLMEYYDVNPYQILALTFTNKAAREMRERVDKIIGYGAENIWVSTFHSTCVRMLRRFIESIGYERNFTIYDTEDQKSLIRDVCKYLDIDTKNMKERMFLTAISSAKDELISPEELERTAGGDFVAQKVAQVYKEYQKRLKANNALDFDDLIFKTVELFQKHPEALTYYQKRFRYIMVDEYQDTNTAQFRFISLLASSTNEFGETEHNLCVVGDDDQSIYKFRGANIRNILDFEKEYPETTIIKLEQNYRSTKSILSAANEVIANNLGRKEKSLWTENEDGEPVTFTLYDTDYEEAASIVDDIVTSMQREPNLHYRDFAILYRTNAQSRAFEEKLILRSVPYKLIGSINFYQRKEIKDLLSYLKTIDNGMDSLAVKRIINIPKRGIGLTTIDRLDSYAQTHNMSFYDAIRHAEYIDGIGRAAAKLTSFVSLIEGLKSRLCVPGYSLKELIDEVLEVTDYIKELEAQDEEDAKDRVENINELINKATAYEESAEEPSLSGFLEEIALVADVDNLEENNDMVVLMTLHSAKGLEFPQVYLAGMEEGIFPSYMSINADHPDLEIEEERRLCYVGLTRAMKHLSLSAARQRLMRGETQFNRPSRFIGEIPRYLLSFSAAAPRRFLTPENTYGTGTIRNQKPVTPAARQLQDQGTGLPKSAYGSQSPFPSGARNLSVPGGMRSLHGVADRPGSSRPRTLPDFEKKASKPAPGSSYLSKPKQFGSANPDTLDYGIGDTVKHPKFGTGIVTDITKGGKAFEVTVDFPGAGVKKMLSSFAKLEKLSTDTN